MAINSKHRTAGLSVLSAAVLLAACANPGDNKTSFIPSQDVKPSSPVDIVEQIANTNQVANTGNAGQNTNESASISNETKFSSAAYGVKGSPRVTTQKRVRKGGGRYQVGKPYTIRGKRYVPKVDPNYKATGLASWYGPNFHGRLTANGEIYDQYSLSAAHPTMPLPSYAKVTNLENGSSVTVRVNDRGPFSRNRIIDLSSRAAELLGYTKKGLAKVRVEYIGKARMDGLDENQLIASYNPGSLDPSSIPSIQSGEILLAQSQPPRQSNAARQTLQSFGQTGFSAPVPTNRPTNTSNGLPVDVTRLGSPRPLSSISGYLAMQSSGDGRFRAFDFNQSPTQSHDLKTIRVGLEENAEPTAELQAQLSGFGPVTAPIAEDGIGFTMLLTFAIEDQKRLNTFLVTNDLIIIE